MSNSHIDDDDALIAELPDLRIEVSHSEDMVILQQRGCGGEEDRIAIHRWQVRMLAEQFGLLPARTQARATVETLARRMRVLHARIDELDNYLCKHSDTEHANMDWEQTYSGASLSIAQEFVADLDALTGSMVTAPKQLTEVQL